MILIYHCRRPLLVKPAFNFSRSALLRGSSSDHSSSLCNLSWYDNAHRTL